MLDVGHWRTLPTDMATERTAGLESDLWRALGELKHAGDPDFTVRVTDEGAERQTDASIATATQRGDEALLAGVAKDKHPR